MDPAMSLESSIRLCGRAANAADPPPAFGVLGPGHDLQALKPRTVLGTRPPVVNRQPVAALVQPNRAIRQLPPQPMHVHARPVREPDPPVAFRVVVPPPALALAIPVHIRRNHRV